MFTPERVAYFTHIWLFDSDVEVYPFALPQLIDVMRALGAAIGQPAIAKPSSSANAKGSTGPELQYADAHRPLSLSCLAAQVTVVEVMTPVIEAEVMTPVIEASVWAFLGFFFCQK